VGTCVRHNGESIIDITISSPVVARHHRHRDPVEPPLHRDGHWGRLGPAGALLTPRRGDRARRWTLTKLDEEALETALTAVSWTGEEQDWGRDILQAVEWLRGTMWQVCDVSMHRAKSCHRRRAAYWWTDEIAELRTSSVRARRVLTRTRRRGRGSSEQEALIEYRTARAALARAIPWASEWKSRASCWEELLSSLNEDLWGRPYKLVVNRHRAWTPPIAETLESRILSQVVDTLFPQSGEGSTLDWGLDAEGP